jgi:hypothetical protein
MSEIKVNKISQRSGTAITLGNSGTDFQLPSGADIVAQSGSTITIASGATITNNGTSTGFGPTGAVSWNTTAVTSSPITVANGIGYFINTTSGAITVNLPVGTAGAIIALADYAGTWNTNNVTLNANGTEKIGGVASAPATLSTQGQSVTFVYVDSTRGWINVGDATYVTGSPYISATGGTILTCGNFKTHVFTGPGTFTVTNAGQPTGSTSVEYMVVAGGGGSGKCYGGGGGAGGYRQNYPSPVSAGLPVTATSYPITVGSGGGTAVPPARPGTKGSDSVFSTITSTGGGFGATWNASPGFNSNGGPGGSGGGGGGSGINQTPGTGGTGNTPPVSPPQGNPGGQGAGPGQYGSAGGGGASTAGAQGSSAGGCNGGAGSPIAVAVFGPTSPSYGTPGPAAGRYFAGGGSGYGNPTGGGGVGGGGNVGPTPGANGVVNTGGGGGAEQGSGGSGIVVIRYRFQ